MDPGVIITERIRNERIIKPILYGNTAKLLPRKLENNHTHEWTVYLRAYDNEDLSKYIRKVQFKLHESYPNPVRVIDEPPFELSETGWGEFEVQIKLYFIDVNEKPVTIFYYLRLFQPLITLPDNTQIVVNEFYDEIIFNEPTEPMYRVMNENSNTKSSKHRHIDYNQVKRQSKEKLQIANKEILAEISDLRSSLKDALELIQKVQKDLDSNVVLLSTPLSAPSISQGEELSH